MVLRDKDLRPDYYLRFDPCELGESGHAVLFRFAGGAHYYVPLEYVVQWFRHPHYRRTAKGLRTWRDMSWQPSATMRASRCRRVLGRQAVRLELVSGEVFDILWETVLMACEPRYEHFGGLIPRNKHIAADGLAEFGPFAR